MDSKCIKLKCSVVLLFLCFVHSSITERCVPLKDCLPLSKILNDENPSAITQFKKCGNEHVCDKIN